MAIGVMNGVLQGTGGRRAGARPSGEYWPPLIAAVRRRDREFLFGAEAYWDLEWELERQGFDYCYDKRLYDLLERGSAESVQKHLQADLPHQERLVRFIENHDHRRAPAPFPAKGP